MQTGGSRGATVPEVCGSVQRELLALDASISAWNYVSKVGVSVTEHNSPTLVYNMVICYPQWILPGLISEKGVHTD